MTDAASRQIIPVNEPLLDGAAREKLMRDDRVAQRARSGRNLAFRTDPRFFHTELGHNYRMTNLQAAIGVAQLRAMPEHLRRKREMGRYYTERLSGCVALETPVERPWAKNVYWSTASSCVKRRRMHEQPALRRRGLFTGER